MAKRNALIGWFRRIFLGGKTSAPALRAASPSPVAVHRTVHRRTQPVHHHAHPHPHPHHPHKKSHPAAKHADVKKANAVPTPDDLSDTPLRSAAPEAVQTAAPDDDLSDTPLLSAETKTEKGMTPEEVASAQQLLGEDGWMQKVAPLAGQPAASAKSGWRRSLGGFAHTYMPTFFGPAPAQTTVPAASELLQEEGWMEKATKKEVDAKFGAKPGLGAQMNDLVHMYLPTFFGPKKTGPRILPADSRSVPREMPEERSVQSEPSPAPAEAASESAEVASGAPAGGALAEAVEAPMKETKGKKSKEKAEKPKSEQPKIVAPEKPASIGPVPAPAVAAPADPAPIIKKSRRLSTGGGFSGMLATIGNIGLGKEKSLFVESMATMLEAGLPLLDSLKTLEAEVRSRKMRKIILKIRTDVENGQPLWRSMEAQHLFSPHALALVRIGEEAGNLAKNMQYLAIQEEKDHALKGKVKMAMIYPSIVCVLMFVIVMGLGLFVLPQLVGVLYSLNVPLPLVTRIVIFFSESMSTHGAIVVPGTIGAVLLLAILAKFTPLRVVSQWVLFQIPGVGRLAREATIARFGVILGGLLQAGVPVVEGLQSLVDVTPIVSYRKFYQKLLERIQLGDSFAKSFSEIKHSTKILPPTVQQLVMTGERSGALASILLKVADIYDRKASETAQKLPVILEPILLLFIGGLVGTIAFAIIVPIYGIVGSVGR